MNKRQKYHSDWSKLPEDLVRDIMERIPLLDLINFTCVCSSWRCISIAKLTQLRLSPWVIFPSMVNYPEPKGLDSWHYDYCCDGSVSFYSITTGITYNEQIPETVGHGVRVVSPGWFITIHPTENTNKLYHVFTRKFMDLPPFPYPHKSFMPIKKAVTYPNPSSQLVIAAIQYENRSLHFYRRENKSWQCMVQEDNCHYIDITFYKEDLYALKYTGEVYVVTGLNSSSIPSISVLMQGNELKGYDYLVTTSENLYLVTILFQVIEGEDVLDTPKVSKLDFAKCRWVKVEDLGDCALFIDSHISFSVTASNFSGCRRNCVYFSTYSGQGIFNLEDGTVEKLFPTECRVSHSFFSAALSA